MYRKSTFEERLEIVLKIKSGYPLKSLCKELNLDRDFVRDWLQKYDENGESGLRHKVITYDRRSGDGSLITFYDRGQVPVIILRTG